MDNASSLPYLIGSRVAERRATLDISLTELEGRTGVSRAMISRIERGEVHASAVLLDKLCAGLGLSLSALFAREDSSPLLRRADQPVWQDPYSRYIRREVAPGGTGSAVRIVEVEFPAGAEVSYDRSRHRVIAQHVWMLDGEMEITVAGVAHNLSAGDCMFMRLTDRNSFRNLSGKPARYAVILTLEPAA
ncbi:MAG TPA: XRE family transcriptional regulator [Dongiaceae bacterium]|nr:XRE family transcriptional regulator [Dongiaceae bacterium]